MATTGWRGTGGLHLIPALLPNQTAPTPKIEVFELKEFKTVMQTVLRMTPNMSMEREQRPNQAVNAGEQYQNTHDSKLLPSNSMFVPKLLPFRLPTPMAIFLTK